MGDLRHHRPDTAKDPFTNRRTIRERSPGGVGYNVQPNNNKETVMTATPTPMWDLYELELMVDNITGGLPIPADSPRLAKPGRLARPIQTMPTRPAKPNPADTPGPAKPDHADTPDRS